MTTVESERVKYWRMWQVQAYRRSSPGERAVTHFRSHVKYAQGDSLIDLGCGTGRAGLALAQKKFKVTLFDLVPEAVGQGVTLPFIEGNLWDLPAHNLPVFDWIYCADVLEHIPPEHVDSTLAGMAAITGKGGFFSISHVLDGYGQQINERLHLTVEPWDWWLKKIQGLWEVPEFETFRTASWVILGKPING